MSLLFVSYVPGTKSAQPSSAMPDDVRIDNKNNAMWIFKKGDPKHEQRFTIGSGIRIPEGDELFGPMMVIVKGNRVHEYNLRRARSDLKEGKLTR